MTSIVTFLEQLGSSPNAGRMSSIGYTRMVDALGLNDDARDALLLRDVGALGRLAGAREELRCFISMPD